MNTLVQDLSTLKGYGDEPAALNSRHWKNLKKLRAFVASNPLEEYYMRSYLKAGLAPRKLTPNCGTVGCLIGWTPSIPNIELAQEAVPLLDRMHCFEIGEDVYGMCEDDTKLGQYLFGIHQNGDKDACLHRIDSVLALQPITTRST